MTDQEIWGSLERIFNMTAKERYTDPAADDLHRECLRRVEEMSRSEMRLSLSRYVRDTMLSEEALANQGGWDDVLAFLDWVDGGME